MSFELKKLDELKSRVPNNRRTNSTSLVSTSNLDSRIAALAQTKSLQAMEIMRNAIDVTFIIDCSGSCSGIERDTCEGFRYFIEKEKMTKLPTYLTTILFNDDAKYIHKNEKIENVKPFEYCACGRTALYDTLCDYIISKTDSITNSSKKIIVIMTDGYDVSSYKYNLSKTRNMIKNAYSLGYEFILLGTSISAKDLARELGIKEEFAEDYTIENNGVFVNFDTILNIIKGIRKNGKIPTDWSKSVKEHLALTLNNSNPTLTLERKY